MASFNINSSHVHSVGTPLSNFSPNSNVASVQHSPVTSFVVPGSMEPLKIVSSPNITNSGSFEFSPSPNSGLHNGKTREISTVYLPPIRYRYDNATGTLVQVGGPSPTHPQAKSPVATDAPNFTQFNTPFVSYSPNFTHQANPLSQNANLFTQNSNVFNNPQTPMNQGFTVPNFTSQSYTQVGAQTYAQAGPQTQPFVNGQFDNTLGSNPVVINNAGFGNSVPTNQTGFGTTSGPTSQVGFGSGGFSGQPVFSNNFGFGNNAGFPSQPEFLNTSGFQSNTGFSNQPGFTGGFGNFQGGQTFLNIPFRPVSPRFSGQPFHQNTPAAGPGPFGNQGFNVPTFGNQQAFDTGPRTGNFHNYNNNLYMDTPRARYEAAVKDYYDRMNGNFQNYNPAPESPNGLAQAFSTFENVASKFFSGTDGFVSDFKDVAFKILNPNSSDYLKAAVFKLQRLENVPVNPNSVSKLSFNVVVYFDPSTENYDVHKSEKQWALPTEKTGIVDCDLKGETLKIPWKGEEFIFLKILENVGPNKFVLGRLQLKLDTLVTGRPLKVTVIGDDGHPKGSAILEFAVGAVSMEEVNQMNSRIFMNATHRKNNEERSNNNRMPGYEAMLEEKNVLESGTQDWPKTKLMNKNQKYHKGRGNLPPPFKYLVSWCCDITDQDLA